MGLLNLNFGVAGRLTVGYWSTVQTLRQFTDFH